MNNIKEIAIKIFDIKDQDKCKCGGAHDVCLNCRVCRADKEDQLPKDFTSLAQYIDHTALKPDTTESDIDTLCKEAEHYGTKSVCVNPLYVSLAHKNLNNVLTCTVVGFPLSNSLTSTILQEVSDAIKNGAEEVDMVIKSGWLKDKKYLEVLSEITDIADLCHEGNAILKVILENCLLTEEEIIIASLISKKAGADFVKTSTGFNKSGAKLSDVELMRKVVGPKLGVKAAGGIRDRETAIAMLKAGANRIGASATKSIVVI